MALDLRQNFVSAQYLENKLTEFHQIFNMHSYWQNLVYYRVMSLHWCQNLFLLNIFRFSCLVSLELGLFISWKSCIGATARFSDNSSFTWIYKIFFTLHVFKPFCTFAWLIILDNNHRVMLTHPCALHRNPFVPVFKCSFSSQWENKTLQKIHVWDKNVVQFRVNTWNVLHQKLHKCRASISQFYRRHCKLIATCHN